MVMARNATAEVFSMGFLPGYVVGLYINLATPPVFGDLFLSDQRCGTSDASR
jgi:hypothetical protein